MARRGLRAWHRRLGALVAVLLIIITVTGIALNHTTGMRLDERYVRTGWLLDWYGIAAPDPPAAASVDDRRIVVLGDQLYVDETLIAKDVGRLIGAVRNQGMLVVALPGELVLLTPQLEIVERLSRAYGLPARVEQLGVAGDGELVIRANGELWRSDVHMLGWQRAPADTAVTWSVLGPAPADLVARLKAEYRGRVLTAEKLLLDLHSGRVAGAARAWLMDAVGIAVLLLAGTGLWLWAAGRR